MCGENKLQIRKRIRERRNHRTLPFRMDMQVDLIDKNDTFVLNQSCASGCSKADVIQEIADPPNIGSVPVGKRRKWHRYFMDFEQIISALQLGGKLYSRWEQLVDQRDDLLVAPRIASLPVRQPRV